MRDTELGFFDWQLAAEGVIEVAVRDDVELRAEHVTRAMALFRELMPGRFCVLAERKEGYAHTLESMVKLSQMEDVLLYAVVVRNTTQRELGRSHQLINPKVELFPDRSQALRKCVQVYTAWREEFDPAG